MKVLICGGRDFDDKAAVERIIQRISEYNGKEVSLVISGGASGADHLAIAVAKEQGIPCAVMEAQWDKYGKAAGPIRNGWMLKHLNPDIVVAFPGGRGTQDMKNQTKAAGVKLLDLGSKK